MSTKQNRTAGKRGFLQWNLLKRSFSEMRKNGPLRMAGATSFFTTFALPPIMIILLQLFSLFMSRSFVGEEMMEILSDNLGKESAEQIRITTRGFRTIAQNWYTAVAGFLFLVFVATTLFTVIKNTLNDIWQIKAREKAGILFNLHTRARSILIILVAGILFLAAIFMDGVAILLGNYMEELWPGGGNYFGSVLNEVVTAITITIWFILLFRYLADARPFWRVSIAGGCLTGVLFAIGKTLLSFLMQKSNIGTIYGASGSIVLILLFVFYSSFILYFGASFIKVYAESSGQSLKPIDKAYQYKLQKVN